jgi:hypothetical protein
LTVMTQTITDDGNQDAYLTCWVTLLKLLCLFLPVDKTVVLGTGSLNCKPKKHKRFGIKVYKLCNVNECTYDTVVYLGKNRPLWLQIWQLCARQIDPWQNRWRDLDINYIWTVFSPSPDIFNNLTKMKINCYETIDWERWYSL